MGRNKKRKGIMLKDLGSIKKGTEVIVEKCKQYDSDCVWTGEWEYHYYKITDNWEDRDMMRSKKFLVDINKF